MHTENSPNSSPEYGREIYASNIFIVLTGLLASALGAVVIVGWYTHNTKLIQIHPSFVAMQYNTALGFILGGVGLIAFVFRRFRLALTLSVILGIIALLTLIEYIFGVNLGIDQLLMEHYITVKTSHPGRMAPTTAVSFLLIPAALLTATTNFLPMRRLTISAVLSSVLLALGLGNLLIYISGLDGTTLFGLDDYTFMALHTAIGFTFLGAGIFVFVLRGYYMESIMPRWLPVVASVVLIIVTIGLWEALKTQELDRVNQIIDRQTKNIEINIQTLLQSESLALIRMAKRWENSEDMSRAQWQSDAKNYTDHMPGLKSIAWVDTSFHALWIEPADSIEFYQKDDLLQERQYSATKEARDTREITVSKTIELLGDNAGFRVFVPLYRENLFQGFIVGLYDAEELFDYIFVRAEDLGYSVEVYGGEQKIYSTLGLTAKKKKSVGTDLDLKFYNLDWRIKVWPTEYTISKFQSYLPEAVLAFGILMAILLPLTVYQFQTSSARADLINKSNIALEKEVSERKKLLNELERTNYERELILDTAAEGIYGLDLNGNTTFVNPAAAGMIGWKVEEILGKSQHDIIHHSKADGTPYPREQCPIYAAYKDGKTRRIEDEVFWKKDGTSFPVEYTSTPVRDKTGEITGAVVTFRDISERKRHDDLIRESEERFRGAFENSAVGMALVSPEGRWLQVNSALCEIVGYNEKELLEIDFQTITHPDDLEIDLDRVQKLLNGEITRYRMEKRYFHKAGHIVWVLLSVSLVRDTKGDPLYFISQIQDITRRKEAEEALNETLEQLSRKSRHESIINDITRSIHRSIRLEDVLENAAKSMHTNLDEVENVAIYLVEGKMAKMKSHRGFPGWFTDAVTEIPYPKGYTWKVISENKQIYCEDVEKDNAIGPAGRKLGTKSYVSFPIRQEEKAIGCININSPEKNAFSPDDLKLLEIIARQIEVAIENAKQAQELERSNNELQQFAYVASHDLQEPLRMVSSYLQLLERRYKEKLDSDACEFIEYAVDGSKRMQSLINDLLMFSRVATKGKEFVTSNLESVLDNALSNLKVAIEESCAVVTHGPLPDLEVDSIQITQLFQNIIANAIKYRDTRPPEIHVGAEEKNGEWVFTVKDNGIGIDSDYFERIFVIFQRLHTLDKYKGTGMGLAMCKKIVERHGGRIWVESEPGKGSVFYFTIRSHDLYQKEVV